MTPATSTATVTESRVKGFRVKAARFFLPLTLCFLVACAPAAGRPAIAYSAKPADVIAAVAQFGPQIQPSGVFNFFGIETINDRYITLVASQTTGMQFLSVIGGTNPYQGIRATVTVAPSQRRVTQVAVSVTGGGSGDNQIADRIIAELDGRFDRASQPGAVAPQ